MKKNINCYQNENQSGRTILEMLGVLAIMGIITYGAIAGINYGMTSYKINQTYAEVQDIIQGIQDLYSWSQTYPDAESMMKAACSNDIFTNACDTNNEYNKGAWGNISINPINDNTSFQITVTIDDNVRSRITGMDWTGVKINAVCQEGAGNCTFSPL